MAEEQAISDEVMREARKLLAATAEAHRKRTGATLGLARALLAAEKRGADRQKEADARIAEEYAAELVEQSPLEDTPEWSRLMLVYAKHVRRAAYRIRSQ